MPVRLSERIIGLKARLVPECSVSLLLPSVLASKTPIFIPKKAVIGPK